MYERLQEAEVAAEAGEGRHDVTGCRVPRTSSSPAENRQMAHSLLVGLQTLEMRAVQMGVLVRERNTTWSPPEIKASHQ